MASVGRSCLIRQLCRRAAPLGRGGREKYSERLALAAGLFQQRCEHHVPDVLPAAVVAYAARIIPLARSNTRPVRTGRTAPCCAQPEASPP